MYCIGWLKYTKQLVLLSLKMRLNIPHSIHITLHKRIQSEVLLKNLARIKFSSVTIYVHCTILSKVSILHRYIVYMGGVAQKAQLFEPRGVRVT